MGVEAARMVAEGAWGQAVVYRQGQVTRAPIRDLMAPPRLIHSGHPWLELARTLGAWI
jgi:hypothetical protein